MHRQKPQFRVLGLVPIPSFSRTSHDTTIIIYQSRVCLKSSMGNLCSECLKLNKWYQVDQILWFKIWHGLSIMVRHHRSIWIQMDRHWDYVITFCCRGPISNLRPVLDSSAKTTRGMLLVSFCKTSKHARLTTRRVLVFSRGISKLIFCWVGITYRTRVTSVTLVCVPPNFPLFLKK